MQPVVHVVVGYLCYAAYVRWRRGRGATPADGPALVALFGAALPDLVDQPLWLVGVTPVGRTVVHSSLVAIPTILLVQFVTRRRDEPTLEVTTLWLEAVILVAGVALWWHDGRPGLEPIRSRL